ncbi:MAG TPA: hypothetical protein DEA08_09565 [Planctomycetes bacterium]|nr:hypothetical protein [Planctomycetota bacterium]
MGPPGAEWDEVVAALDAAGCDEELVTRAEPLAARWPAGMRRTPRPWLDAILAGDSAPQLALCDSLWQMYTEFGPERARALAQSPAARNLTHLDLVHSRIGEEGARALLTSPHLPPPRRLRLSRNAVGELAVEELCGRPERYAGLSELELESTRLSDEAAVRLLAAEHLSGLRWLSLGKNRHSDAVVHALVSAEHLSQLERLHLHENPISDRAARALASCPRLAGLRELWLNSTDVNDAGGRALAESPHLGGVERLKLNHCDMRSPGVTAVLSAFPRLREVTIDALQGGAPAVAALSARPPGLRKLSMWRSEVKGDDLARFVSSPGAAELREWKLSGITRTLSLAEALATATCTQLEVLQLHSCGVGARVAQALADAPALARLRELDLWSNAPSAGIVMIFASPHLAGLRKLKLSGCSLGPSGGAAFAASRLEHLEELDLNSCRQPPEAFSSLVANPAFARLRSITLHGNHVDDRTLALLSESLPALEQVFASQGRFSAAAIEAAQAARPGLRVWA